LDVLASLLASGFAGEGFVLGFEVTFLADSVAFGFSFFISSFTTTASSTTAVPEQPPHFRSFFLRCFPFWCDFLSVPLGSEEAFPITDDFFLRLRRNTV